MDSRIQSTSDDAVRTKAAAAKAGYFHDPFVAAFSIIDNNDSSLPAVQPIIKRGTFARVACVERALVSFLELSTQTQQESLQPQVVVLGAGKDTSFFRLQAGLIGCKTTPRSVNWFEVDYKAVISTKLEVFRKSASIFGARISNVNEQGGVTMEASDSEPSWQGSYYLVPHDLRDDTDKLSARLDACGFNSGAPTLFVLECCLMYLPEVSTRLLLRGIEGLCTDGYIFMYEPILGTDQFGTMMETNLTRAGVVDEDSTLVQSRTLSRHIDNLVRSGFEYAVGCDMWAAYETVLTAAQRRHASQCEFLDEMEEWMLIMRHYCLVVASTSKSTFGKTFCSVGKDSPMGLVTGRIDEALGEIS